MLTVAAGTGKRCTWSSTTGCAGDYDVFTYRDGSELELMAPRRYLGPGQAVKIRLRYGEGLGTARVRKIRIEQTGRYA